MEAFEIEKKKKVLIFIFKRLQSQLWMREKKKEQTEKEYEKIAKELIVVASRSGIFSMSSHSRTGLAVPSKKESGLSYK